MLEEEGHDITIIENKEEAIDRAMSRLDVTCIHGRGSDAAFLKQAGVAKADLVIAVTNMDETNLICCLLARKLGANRPIARIRNPEYGQTPYLVKDELGLSMTINPKMTAADEIVRMMPYSPKVNVSFFGKGRMEIACILITPDSPLAERTISWTDTHSRTHVQYCLIQRQDEIIIPDGTGPNLLESEAVGEMDAFISLTDNDEENVIIVMTTTGYATCDFNLWPMYSKMVLLILMVIGAMAGSTGGIKVIRTLLLYRRLRLHLEKSVHPRQVEVITVNDKPVSKTVITQSVLFAALPAALRLSLPFPHSYSLL